MKINIVGASHFVNRMFEACGNYQWAREFLKNSLEAGATKIEFGIEWQAVEKTGVYRRTIYDNGSGMSRDELIRFFSTLGEGAKRIGGLHDNFGVGAKIASLPWNPDGLVVISYKGGQASMIRIVLDPESGDYELVEFETEETKTCVIDPTKVAWDRETDIDWGVVAPDWVRDHGTVVVMLGSEEHPDTVLGNPKAGERSIKGLSVYLNTRFWDLTQTEVHVVELRTEKKNSWPASADDRDDARRPNNRRIFGARYYLNDVKATGGKLAAASTTLLDEDRVMVDWYLWEGDRPNVDSYAKKVGYIAVRYRDELFHLTSNKAHFRWFGVAESKVQQNLTIILEPQLYEQQTTLWGVHPDQSRNHLIFTGKGEKGVELPLSEWGLEFAESMPEAIQKAIQSARGEHNGSLDDEEYRKRLQDKFGKRWRVRRLVQAVKGDQRARAATTGSESVDADEVPQPSDVVRQHNRRKRTKTVQVVRMRAADGGAGEGVEREVPVDVPQFRFGDKDNFEQPWHLAVWVPHDPEGPTVLLNRDAPVLKEAIRYHQEQYPDVFAEEVTNIVLNAYGEIAVCKIAHSQKLGAFIAEQDLDRDYRSEAALTVALMGLLAEESLIAQRLGRLGRKKPAA